MIEIHRPRLSFEYVDKDVRRGQLVLEPLEKGYGITVAALMKDILTMQTPGSAPVAISIEGAQHPDQRIKGLVDGSLESPQPLSLRLISLRLKTVHVTINNADSDTVEVNREFKGPVTVKAGDLADDSVTIFDPDEILFDLESGTKLKVKVVYARGSGYQTAQDISNTMSGLPEGTVFLDAMFSPVKRVDYHIGDARIGQEINYDRLVIDVTTDGTLTSRDSIMWAASYLNNKLDVLDMPFGDTVEDVQMVSGKKEPVSSTANISINDVEMTIRVRNCLKLISIETLQDLAAKSPEELLQIKNFGRKSLNELRKVLQNYGLTLSGDRPDQRYDDVEDDEEENVEE